MGHAPACAQAVGAHAAAAGVVQGARVTRRRTTLRDTIARMGPPQPRRHPLDDSPPFGMREDTESAAVAMVGMAAAAVLGVILERVAFRPLRQEGAERLAPTSPTTIRNLSYTPG